MLVTGTFVPWNFCSSEWKWRETFAPLVQKMLLPLTALTVSRDHKTSFLVHDLLKLVGLRISCRRCCHKLYTTLAHRIESSMEQSSIVGTFGSESTWERKFHNSATLTSAGVLSWHPVPARESRWRAVRRGCWQPQPRTDIWESSCAPESIERWSREARRATFVRGMARLVAAPTPVTPTSDQRRRSELRWTLPAEPKLLRTSSVLIYTFTSTYHSSDVCIWAKFCQRKLNSNN